MHRRMMATIVVLLMTMVVALAATSLASSRNFAAPMSGDQEVVAEGQPEVETDATGLAKFQLSADGTELSFRLNVANIENVTQAHIHLAPRGQNGGIVAWLYPADTQEPELIPGRTDGTLATGTITADDLVNALEGATIEDLVNEIRSGNAYANVHTEQFPSGEIRGQIDVPRGHGSDG